MSLILIALLACAPDDAKSEPDIVILSDTGGSGDSEADADSDADSDADADADSDSDLDGDGYSVEDGDCDDSDDDVHPGVEADTCDGIDNDCDGEIDEDFDADEFEPNDTEAADVGDLSEGTITIRAYMSPETDVDLFRFYAEDGFWDWFDIEVWLYGVPDTADYALKLYWVEDSDGDSHGLVASENSGDYGEDEVLDYGGEGLFSDGDGYYEVAVYSVDGGGCEVPYRLEIIAEGFR